MHKIVACSVTLKNTPVLCCLQITHQEDTLDICTNKDPFCMVSLRFAKYLQFQCSKATFEEKLEEEGTPAPQPGGPKYDDANYYL